jgi:hypothetical protein
MIPHWLLERGAFEASSPPPTSQIERTSGFRLLLDEQAVIPVSLRASYLRLEGKTQSELDLPWCTERVNSTSNSDPINIVADWCRSIDLSHRARQQSVERRSWQIKIGKVEKVIEACIRLDCDSFSNGVAPPNLQV